MRNIEVTAKTVDMALEKGLQMLGVNREDVEYNVLCEGSMLKKAVVEIFTFANAEEREEFKANNKAKRRSINRLFYKKYSFFLIRLMMNVCFVIVSACIYAKSSH